MLNRITQTESHKGRNDHLDIRAIFLMIVAHVRFIKARWGAWAWGVGARGFFVHQSCKDLCHIIFIHYNIYTYPVYYFNFPFLLSIPRLGSRNPHNLYSHYILQKTPVTNLAYICDNNHSERFLDMPPKDHKSSRFGE